MTSQKNDMIELSQKKESGPASSQSFLKLKPALITAVAIIILVAAGLIPRLLQKAALTKETRESAIPKVNIVHPVYEKNSGELLLPAEIKPWVEAPIYARASGYLKSWLVNIGTEVKAGQLLAVIETPELDQELDQARHQHKEAEAQLSLAKITAARYAELVKTASVSDQENAEKQADLQLKTAAFSAAEANVRRLEYLQSFSRVTAPFNGTITARKTDIGELISASKELFRLSQTNKLRIYVRVPQEYAPGVLPGQTEELSIPEFPNRLFTAKITRTAGQISDDSRTLLTELEVDNQSGKILAGSFGQIKFVNNIKPALSLPSNSIMFGVEGTQIEIVNAQGKIEVEKVKLGRNFGQTVEVLSGVNANDRVVSNPSESLTAGTFVSVVETVKNKKGGLK